MQARFKIISAFSILYCKKAFDSVKINAITKGFHSIAPAVDADRMHLMFVRALGYSEFRTPPARTAKEKTIRPKIRNTVGLSISSK
jgi:hypothetical protein